MMRVLLRVAASLPLLLLAAAAQAASVTVELRAEALLGASRMVLSDLARVDAGDAGLTRQFAALPVGSAPMAGQIERRSRAQMELALRAQPAMLGQRINWQGASAVTIRRESQLLDRALLQAEAFRHVQAMFWPRHALLDITLAAPLAELALPPGRVTYQARTTEGQLLRARMAVWVDIAVDGTLCRSVAVPLAVVAQGEVLVARRALDAGATLRAGDVTLATQDVAGLPETPLAPAALAGAPRLRAALAPGQVVTARQVAPSGMVLRGDVVTLEMRHHGIVVEARAVAQADAQMGRMVAVKIQQDAEAVAARVIAPGLVQIDGR